MTEDNHRIQNLITTSQRLMTLDFTENSDFIRNQLMKNRETIESYKTWNKSAEFNPTLLSNLESNQSDLEGHFTQKWNVKIESKHNMLKFNEVYRTQTEITVESHAGNTFYHFFDRYIVFYENGFYTSTVEKPNRSKTEIIKRIKTYGKNYNNRYELIDGDMIIFNLNKKEFIGTIIHGGIVGQNIKLGSYGDGLINETDQILVNIEYAT